MALTFNTSFRRTGPGALVSVNIPSGPVPYDDYIVVEVRDASFNSLLVRGVAVTEAFLDVPVVLGAAYGRVLAEPMDRLRVELDSIGLQAFQFHANGSLVDQSTQQFGWQWDPTGGLYMLIGIAANRPFPETQP